MGSRGAVALKPRQKPKKSKSVLKRTDEADFPAIDAGDRDGKNLKAVPGRFDNKLRFDLKSLRGERDLLQNPPGDKAKPALAVRDPRAGNPRKNPGHQMIGRPSRKRHSRGIRHPISQNEIRLGMCGGREEPTDLRRQMLAVGIHRENPPVIRPEGFLEALPQGRTFAAIFLAANHAGTRFSSLTRCAVLGGIVHDNGG